MIKCKDVKEIKIEWIQQGHSTLDPTGQRQFEMSCLWANAKPEELDAEIEKANAYAVAQKWRWHLITVK